LAADKKAGEKINEKEYELLKPLATAKISKDHSRCLHCGHHLKWYDMIPLVSWVSLKGHCRYCHKSIGALEPLVELGVAAFFVASYLLWSTDLTTPIEWTLFGLWLLAGVGWAMLFIYDLKWYLLPDSISFTVIGLGLISAILTVVTSGDPVSAIWNVVGSVGILSGLYLVLYVASKGRWIGFGDIKLGLGLGLFLADWQLAILALFLANLIGCLIVIPLLLTKKLKRNSRIPFGPLLIVGTIIAMLIGPNLVELYLLSLL
jgi:leader peptidase (prepilin peptidase)/N-methyltransferase